MLLMENGNRREVSGHLMGKKCKNCCILMGKRIFAEAAPVSRYAVMLVTASFIAACDYLHLGLFMYASYAFIWLYMHGIYLHYMALSAFICLHITP